MSTDDEIELMPWYEHSILYWNPTLETWENFNKRIDALFSRYKELYKKRTEEFLKQNNFVKGKEKQEDVHFEWFVRYQIQGWSKEKIAKEYYVTRQNVSNAIKEIADLVGLKPRPASKGGRPKKR
ncbi:mitochondrial outer membrane protein IML2 [Thermoanaerobacterium thermosaccharolyticum]|uniref:Mitochondrial outer membrane protein IML2 n=1 Tax=Thermoanaerobacterium thermosaccharolyticum TaxID=1517 RepID=A0A223HYA9_THETR|nr:mitochondrial outer membrane protein IML2 [Thermoanaerobacterium thermosaccharolyticum]